MSDLPPEAQQALARAESLNAELRRLLDDLGRPKRYGWTPSRISADMVDYILKRQSIMDAIRAVKAIAHEDLGDNRELNEKIRENALHALATLIRAMQRAETDKIIECEAKTAHADYVHPPGAWPFSDRLI